ncbi:MAG TPA: R3H domain-containing nucleic acid-binding protein [Candidatus Limnocylindrales bacterium]|nr:R3H domain-containing nucleic acid-binding protein [Candidatus Limnocylindrales bacterium]
MTALKADMNDDSGVNENTVEARSDRADDLEALLIAFPPEIANRLRSIPAERDMIEIVMDLGRRPEARFGGGGEEVLLERDVTQEDIQYVVDHIGSFGDDNRAGIERTLHRISAIRNRSGKIVGLTARIGRAVFGTIEIIKDLVESGKSVLIMGRPGIGKTTMLREAARVLADEIDKRVVVVDTSNEIAGDGDIPHPGIGRARRMQVRTPEQQHGVMIEAVENHMPQVIVIDEIGTELEASAARTIAERGVQLIGTAHGNNLDNLMLNPTLSDLIGGIQSVTLGDEEARRRRSQKSVLERKAPPTFDVVVEIQSRDRVTVHADVSDTVDAMLRGDPVAPELRYRDEGGVHRSQARPRPGPQAQIPGERFGGLVASGGGASSFGGWRTEPGWRPDARRGEAAAQREPGREAERGYRPGYHPGATGGWRRGSTGGAGGGGPFLQGEVADSGPLERGTPEPEHRARDIREYERQREWRESASRAITQLRAGETSPDNEDADVENEADELQDDFLVADYSLIEEELSGDRRPTQLPASGSTSLPTLKALPHGVSNKKLEQAIRELDLPVTIVRDADEADVVITLRNHFKQKAPALREAEERGLPIFVLKSNTLIQLESALTSIFALEVDPRDAALREVEEAIGLVHDHSKPVELSPQNSYIRRMQHQMAERANLVSQSRGREPYRRVRLYPDSEAKPAGRLARRS